MPNYEGDCTMAIFRRHGGIAAACTLRNRRPSDVVIASRFGPLSCTPDSDPPIDPFMGKAPSNTTFLSRDERAWSHLYAGPLTPPTLRKIEMCDHVPNQQGKRILHTLNFRALFIACSVFGRCAERSRNEARNRT